ncbi:hypothetical protein [Parasphingopyxis sp.]|uniref:hypothetical protein n=1 Tax=Parasphingopyxis sp. TaxID=1920299 RepID=UPI00260656AF|nr:hypothetical protein [Parasphingopyxis sp.]
MNQSPVLNTYDDWKHCITVSCGIPLTMEYVEARMAALADKSAYGTMRFVEVWGERHLEQVKEWFAQAHRELSDQT